MRKPLIAICLLVLTMGASAQSSGSAFASAGNTAARKPFNLTDIEDLLKGSVTPKRVAMLVKQYGVSFELTDSIENDLRELGADDNLLLAITKNRVQPDRSVAPPVPAPQPAPPATLLIRADLAARIRVDSQEQGVIQADQSKIVAVGIGEHLVEAEGVGTGHHWEKTIEVKAAGQMIVTTDLVGVGRKVEAEAARKQAEEAERESSKTTPKGSAEQQVATIETSMGNLTCVLFPKASPLGTANFIALARGTKDWTDPRTGKIMHGVPLYDNTTFHRVIPEFMIQGGDPAGNGTGNPGYQFKNESWPDLRFDLPGRLAYANAGRDTNGSQFFVTEVPTAFLDGNYTIFGQCDAASVELVKKIARQPRNAQDRPNTAIVIKHIRIDDGTAAKHP